MGGDQTFMGMGYRVGNGAFYEGLDREEDADSTRGRRLTMAELFDENSVVSQRGTSSSMRTFVPTGWLVFFCVGGSSVLALSTALLVSFLYNG
jgi:hypothetical protein